MEPVVTVRASVVWIMERAVAVCARYRGGGEGRAGGRCCRCGDDDCDIDDAADRRAWGFRPPDRLLCMAITVVTPTYFVNNELS